MLDTRIGSNKIGESRSIYKKIYNKIKCVKLKLDGGYEV